ncbi:MAG: Bug family tripartite tricarboxylate transporter substrate binding protein [Spirochaetota bacterium]
MRSFSKKGMKLVIVLAVLIFAAGGVLMAEGAQERTYPQRPVTYIVGWSEGGGSDIVSRVLTAEAEKHLGQPITIVNHPGGSGTRSYSEIADAKPDGYTIGNTTGTISTHKFMGNLEYGHEEFVPIITFNYDPGGIWVKHDAPWETLEDLVEDLKADPESVTIASSNPGSVTRFGTLLLEDEAGVQFKIASQSGGESKGPGLVAGGHVDACQAAPVTAKSLYEAGEIRPLGVMAEERLDAFPEIPTYIEQGYDVTIANYRQVIAPKDVSDDVVDALTDAFTKAARSDKYVNFMEDSGSIPLDWGPEKSRQHLEQQDELFKGIIEDAGLLEE